MYYLIDAHQPLVGWGGAGLRYMRSGYEFTYEMLLIVVIEANGSVEIIITAIVIFSRFLYNVAYL